MAGLRAWAMVLIGWVVWIGASQAADTSRMGSNFLEQGNRAMDAIQTSLGASKGNRERSSLGILGTYSLIDTWIPSKYGASIAFVPSAASTFEFEYVRGSLGLEFLVSDIGKFLDERYSLLYRSFGERNSFHFISGISYHSMKVTLGDRLLTAVNSTLPQLDLVKVRTAGVTLGLGNRWQFEKGWALGVDWFSVYVPIKTFEASAPYLNSGASSTQKEEVDDTMNLLKRIPTTAIFKFQLGFFF